jgi:TonB family protein
MKGTKHAAIVALALTVIFATSIAAQSFRPAIYRGGNVPALPVLSMEVGGGEVLVEATVSSTGQVIDTRPLRTTAGFTDRVVNSLRGWDFVPAEQPIDPARRVSEGATLERAESRVLVAAMFRAPTLNTPTLGEPILNVAAPSEDVPFPLSTAQPPFPPSAAGPGVVLVEVLIDDLGRVTDALVRQSAPPFDGPARDAARQWRFRPAQIRGRSVPSVAYIIFGFPVPIGPGSGPLVNTNPG